MNKKTLQVRKRSSKSPGYQPGTAIPLHETRNQIIQLVPGWITHKSGECKLILSIEVLPNDGTLEPLSKMRLSEEATQNLIDYLPALNEMRGTNAQTVGVLVPQDEMNSEWMDQVLSAISRPEFAAFMVEKNLSEAMRVAISENIRIVELRKAVQELRDMLGGGVVLEGEYQDWCERHIWAFGNAYVARDQIRQVSAEAKVDIMLRGLVGFRDIVELKRPDKNPLVKSDQFWTFSAPCSSAIGQCHTYLDILHRDAEAGLRHARHVVAYHPRAIIVMGRSDAWEDAQHRALRGLNHRLHGISIMTYDQLLAQCVSLVDFFAGKK